MKLALKEILLIAPRKQWLRLVDLMSDGEFAPAGFGNIHDVRWQTQLFVNASTGIRQVRLQPNSQ